MFGLRFTRFWGSDSGTSAAPEEAKGAAPAAAEQVLFEAPGGLYIKREPATNAFTPLKTSCRLRMTQVAGDCLLEVRDGDDALLQQSLADNMRMTFHHPSNAVMWFCIFGQDLRELCFRFAAPPSASQTFINLFQEEVYRMMTGAAAPPVSAADDRDDYNYATAPLAAEAPVREASPEAAEPQNDEVFTLGREGSIAKPQDATSQMACFADSYKYNRMVTLGTRQNGAVEAIAVPYGEPGLIGGGESMLVRALEKLQVGPTALASIDQTQLHCVTYAKGQTAGDISTIDLPTGEVVQTYKGGDKFPVARITNRAQSAALDPHLLTCLAPNVAFCVDTRSNGVVAEAGKSAGDYSIQFRKGQFSCHATSEKGHLAIGDSLGDVRLYSGPPGSQREDGTVNAKAAKTLLKGATLGQGVTAIDITPSGDLVAAAVGGAVLLFPTHYAEKSGKATNGFVSRMGANKPSPLRLLPPPAVTAQLGRNPPPIHSVRFDHRSETAFIVAHIGDFLLTWSMAKVRSCLKDRTEPTCQSTRVDTHSTILQLDTTKDGKNLVYLSKDALGTRPLAPAQQPRTGFSYFAK